MSDLIVLTRHYELCCLHVTFACLGRAFQVTRLSDLSLKLRNSWDPRWLFDISYRSTDEHWHLCLRLQRTEVEGILGKNWNWVVSIRGVSLITGAKTTPFLSHVDFVICSPTLSFLVSQLHCVISVCVYGRIVYLTALRVAQVVRSSVVGWSIMLQAGWSRVRFPISSLDFSVDLVLQAHWNF
jgi:hypothetical protein